MNDLLFILIIFFIILCFFFNNKEQFNDNTEDTEEIKDYNCIPYNTLKNQPGFDETIPYGSKKIKFKLVNYDDQSKENEYSECVICNPGEYVTGSGCKKCEEGSITTVENSFECKKCLESQYTHGPGDTQCRTLSQ